MTDAGNTPNLGGLMALGARGDVDVGPTLLRVMTDHYVQQATHTAEEQRQFTELVLRLIGRVDDKTRQRVMRKIAGYAGAPESLRHHLLRTRIAVDDTSAPPLDEVEILYSPRKPSRVMLNFYTVFICALITAGLHAR